MHPKGPNEQSAGGAIAIGDIYHVVFKHKWLISFFSFLGITGAVAMWFLCPPSYVSEAKILIRYVEDAKSLSPSGDTPPKMGDTSGVGVLETEASILSSMDVAAAAADAVGIDKVLGKGSAEGRDRAAITIRRALNVDVPKRGNVLFITYEHPNPNLVQPVLSNILKNYYIKHLESHKNVRFVDEFLTQQVDDLRSGLNQTEEAIRQLKEKVGPIPLEDARKIYGERYSKIRDELDTAEAELNERLESIKVLEKASAAQAAPDTASATNQVADSATKASAEAISDYKRIITRLDAAYKQQENLLSQFTEESSMVKANKGLIASLEAQKTAMEHVHPGIREKEAAIVVANSPNRRETGPAADLIAENARVAALRARVKTLTDQFDRIKTEERALDEIEGSYVALQRKRQLQETQYIYYSRNLEQAKTDSQLGAGKLSNISEIQAPSVPVRDSKKLKKMMIAIAGGGIGAGFGLAFLLELGLAQTVRKPDEVESRLNVPVFLTIPEIAELRKEKRIRALPNGAARAALPAPPSTEDNGKALVHAGAVDGRHEFGDIAPWEEHHSLHGYSEGLRDRLVTYFEMKGFKHKPKLVALTSCSHGAGVTSLAAGLAASLSETGEGNVLLVDLTGRGSAHPFYRGKPVRALADVLEGENIGESRSAARVNDNLYLVHGGQADDRLSKVVPQRLAHLLPKLQQTDYDYIIFDMPPITQTSVTPRLAGFMDMLFVVVEAEKTNREWLKRAAGLLKQSNTNFAAVFNKRRDYAPRWLHQEF